MFTVVLLLCFVAVPIVLGIWFSIAIIHLAFRLLFGMIGLLLGGVVAISIFGIALVVGGALAIAMLPVLGLLLLPFAVPLLLFAVVIRLLTRQSPRVAVAR